MSLRNRILSPYLLMLLPPLFWAGNAVAGRAAVGHVPPVALSFWRWLLAFLFILPMGLPRLAAQWHGALRQWKLLVALAASGISIYSTVLYVALTSTTAVNATLVGAAIPVAIVLVSWLWLGDRVSARQGGGILVSLLGVLAVIARGDPATLRTLSLHTGDLWMLAAVADWAVYSVLLKRHPPLIDPVALTTAQIGLGCLLLLPFYGWEVASGQGFELTWQSAGLIAYVALFPSALAYHLWNQGVLALGPNLAGQYTYLIPLFTALLAALFLGEAVRWFHLGGLVLIFSGIWLATKR